MYEELFIQRLIELRSQRGVSARDMSLSIGQNPGYINTIENGKSFPTMTNFFCICDYLQITPMEFFNTDTHYPTKIKQLANKLNSLSEEQLDIISALVDQLADQRYK